MAGVEVPEFPVVFRWAEHFADWHVDDAHRDCVACLPAHEVGAAARHCELCGAVSHLSAGSVRGCTGRSSGPSAGADLDTGSGNAAIAGARGTDADSPGHDP